MRVISGIYKRRRFDVPRTFKARPTTDFAKENLFNVLNNYIDFEEGITALDLFAGTGSISIELVSRGCDRVISIEKDPAHHSFICKIMKEVQTDKCLPIRGDVFKFIKNGREQFDFIFADPPYALKELETIPELIFQNNLLVYNGMYYQIGEEHKEFCAEKTQDEDYYVLTLAAIARELDGKGMNQAKVHIAAGLPLTWVATQKEDFQKYLLQNESVDFIFRNKEYHVEFAGADIYPQGFAAAFYRLQDFKGINMLVDIGNGTMNIMYINNSRPLEKKCFTEKYGTHQCVLAVRESLLKELGTVVDDLVIEQVIRTGTVDIGEKYLTVIRKAAGDYTKEIFHKLREREYNPELMRLYVVGGGGCMIQNFGEYDKSRVTIVRDICATAKGYEAMTVRKIQRNGGMLV